MPEYFLTSVRSLFESNDSSNKTVRERLYFSYKSYLMLKTSMYTFLSLLTTAVFLIFVYMYAISGTSLLIILALTLYIACIVSVIRTTKHVVIDYCVNMDNTEAEISKLSLIALSLFGLATALSVLVSIKPDLDYISDALFAVAGIIAIVVVLTTLVLWSDTYKNKVSVDICDLRKIELVAGYNKKADSIKAIAYYLNNEVEIDLSKVSVYFDKDDNMRLRDRHTGTDFWVRSEDYRGVNILYKNGRIEMIPSTKR